MDKQSLDPKQQSQQPGNKVFKPEIPLFGVPVFPPAGIPPVTPPSTDPPDVRKGERSRWVICCCLLLFTLVMSALCGILAYYLFFS